MKDDLATEQDWVPFHEAARRLAGVDGERLLLPGQVVFTNSSRKLSEAGKNGRLPSRGILDKTGELQAIPPRDWQKCVRDQDGLYAVARKCFLREPGYRIPRYTNVEINWTEFARASEDATNRHTIGRLPEVNMDALQCAFDIECNERGPPDKNGPKDWRTQADLARWILNWSVDRKQEISHPTAKRYAKKLLDQKSKSTSDPF
jgi:hypothetical protein